MTRFDLDSILDELLATGDSDSLLLLLLTHAKQLMTAEALDVLIARAEGNNGRVTTTQRLYEIYAADQSRFYYELFAGIQSREAMKLLRVNGSDDVLDMIEQQAESAMANVPEQAGLIKARLGDLRQLRERTAAELMAEQEAEASRMAQAQAMLPLVERVETWSGLEDWAASEAYLQEHAEELLSDPAANILLALIAQSNGDERLQQLAMLHKRAREIGVAGAYVERQTQESGSSADLAAVEDAIFGWLQTADWSQSQAYIEEHAAVLLTEEAEMVLDVVQQHNPNHPSLPQHQALLKSCRVDGIAAAYGALLKL